MIITIDIDEKSKDVTITCGSNVQTMRKVFLMKQYKFNDLYEHLKSKL